jgi:tetratricopeptide (TPR) repeat protein
LSPPEQLVAGAGSGPAPRRFPWIWPAVFLLAVAAYLPAIRGGFIWDDAAHVTKPDLQSMRGLGRIWFEIGATQQYYPVLHSAFWLEHQCWGDATTGYHLLNVVLHATAACLFILILRRLAVPGAWLAGMIFALHPVCAESVAWIAEQKNTLSTVFYLLAAWAYLRWRRDGRAAPHRWYWLGIALFALALLTKSVTATLPAALLVVLWWDQGALAWRRDVRPLVPWLALGAAAGLFTSWVERQYIGARGAEFDLTVAQRCLLAGRAAWFYLGKLLWPSNLIFIYPRWTVDATGWRYYLYPLLAVAAVLAFWLIATGRVRVPAGGRARRAPLAVALIFLGSLFPALGVVNVYPFVFSYVADHFQYLASLGVITGAAAAWGSWQSRTGTPGAIFGRRAGLPAIAAAVLLVVLGTLTWRQARIYRDPATLYAATIDRNPGCWLAHDELGNLLLQGGRVEEAMAHYREALRIKPDFAQAHNNLGTVLLRQGRASEAIAQFQEALRLRPDATEVHTNLGNAYFDLGQASEAAAHYRETLRLNPRSAEAHNGLGATLLHTGDNAGAIAHFEASLKLKPDNPDICYNLGLAEAGAGRLSEAVAQYEEALRLRPGFSEAHCKLANVLIQTGRFTEAIAQDRLALELRPNYAEAHYGLGLALASLGRLTEAASEYEAALRIQPDFAEAHANLGGVLANLDRLTEGIAELQEAARLEPEDVAVHYNLGLALRAAGRLDEARVQFREAERLRAGR